MPNRVTGRRLCSSAHAVDMGDGMMEYGPIHLTGPERCWLLLDNNDDVLCEPCREVADE